MSPTRRDLLRGTAAALGAAGLKHRPIAVTALDTLEWFKQQPEEFRNGLQLHLERDKRALEAWHARRG